MGEQKLKKGNGEKAVELENHEYEEVEGYDYCNTHKQNCLKDCPPDNDTPFLSDLN